MNTTYLPYYESEVSKRTYSTRTSALKIILKRFSKIKPKDKNSEDTKKRIMKNNIFSK